MKKIMKVANNYLKTSNMYTMGLLKICLISLGGIIGIFLPKKLKKPFFIVFLIAFFATYIPLMIKLIKMFLDD